MHILLVTKLIKSYKLFGSVTKDITNIFNAILY
jgi:hypothetical protein